jgi:chemotaxis signal transduction protein
VSELAPRGVTARALREEFDVAFAAAPREARRDLVALLAIRAGGQALAARVLETAGLMLARKIVPVPSRRPELLGIAGLRGAIVPIYSLARLLGEKEPAPHQRWILLAGTSDRVGFAFGELDGHLLVPAADLHEAAGGGGADGLTAEIAELSGGPLPVLGIPLLLRTITAR